MPRKREKDLREFWPWYEGYFTGDAPVPVPPGAKEPPLQGRRLFQALTIFGAVLMIVYILWALFHEV
jgi:hypothetical protein